MLPQPGECTVSAGRSDRRRPRRVAYDIHDGATPPTPTQIQDVRSFPEWSQRIPEPKTGQLDFTRFPYQRELYDEGEAERDLTIVKSTQVGASAWLVRWALYWADVHGKTALYVFPADKQLNEFSAQRIAPLLRTPALATRVPTSNTNNVGQRQIGEGWLNLRGAQTDRGLESIDADVLALDEFDLIPETAIPIAMRRISSPMSLGLIRRIGWPSLDGYGIAREYDRSDRRRWFIKCPSCNTQQFIRFFNRREADNDGLPDTVCAYVNTDIEKLVCGKCHKPMPPEAVAAGEWVAEHPDRDRRGYHVHRLMVPGVRLDDLIHASRDTDEWKVQSFFNRDLGEPHSPKEGRLSREAIAAAQSIGGGYTQGPWDTGYHGDGLVSMGIDTATSRNLNVRISLHADDASYKTALFLGEVESFDTVCDLMDMYTVRMAAIDHLPEGRLARAFAERFYGRVFICHFLPQTSEDVMTWKPEDRTAGVKRTEAIDATLGLIRQARNRLPQDLPEGYVAQMRNAVRFHEVNDVGRRVVGYRSIGAIDYLMAEVYDLFAAHLFDTETLHEQMTAQTITTLDDHLDFEPSVLHMPGSGEYRAGPDEGDWGI